MDRPWAKWNNFEAERRLAAMTTITTPEAKTPLSRCLAEVEQGRVYLSARGKLTVAMLVPGKQPGQKRRPKVGAIKGAPFEFPTSAFAPCRGDDRTA